MLPKLRIQFQYSCIYWPGLLESEDIPYFKNKPWNVSVGYVLNIGSLITWVTFTHT